LADRTHVLFLCTGNSARSLLAESALRRLGGDRFIAHSAGSHPTGRPHPLALALLRELGDDVSPLRSKSWDEFAGAGAPELDVVITVCDNARGESCPVWSGAPANAHWGADDPAAASGDEAQQLEVFRRVHRELEFRIRGLLALPLEELDAAALTERLEALGKASPPGDA
jgi:arsenate reductase